MDYLDEAILVKDEFVCLLESAKLRQTISQKHLERLYLLTGKIAYLYGHAYLDQYNESKLALISTINEWISSLTYSSFNLFGDKMILGKETLHQINEIKNALKDIAISSTLDDEDDLTIEEIREQCITYLQQENIPQYNKTLYGLILYGQKRSDEISAAYHDDDSEGEKDSYSIYEGEKQSSEVLEHYTTLYDDLYIHDQHYHKAALLNLLENMQ
ncbi:hypothetical protein FYJ79_10375 [Sharpea azabuensis]|uniref:Uncharacterized protein n=1 Tax=Sharpea porci TaxID=2652286 RepID=A0A844FXK8_9FIRM|nr:hypothetical protein [Sharpea porci]MST89970.1 hypothetical protein [Sharpea porci]